MSKIRPKVSLGADPEFFMKSKSTGRLISAIPYIKGGKHDPIRLKNGGGLQSDNVALEFAIPPSMGRDRFVESMKATLAEMFQHLKEDHDLEVLPSAVFDDAELRDPKAREFGCSPDYCAWKVAINESPSHPDHRFRSCGGHIHVGCLDENGDIIDEQAIFLLDDIGKINTVRGMDLFLGVISTILDNSKEAVDRRGLYGKAGCHRPTQYGVEYRTLSNWWTKSPHSSMLVASLTEDVISVVASGTLNELTELFPEPNSSHIISGAEICRIINTGDAASARKVLDEILVHHMSEDSKHFLEVCLQKLPKTNTLTAEWGLK